MKLSFLFLLLLISFATNAQINTDGRLGPALNLQGPEYQIGHELGQQHGSNLFHSFQDFNLNPGESATFSGPNSVSNVLSRVTGGNPSKIDGTIRSMIPYADMYFINPYGIMFGPNAQLDIQGSFHASTADYLRLGEGGRFDARHPSESLLSVAPIESFGFWTNTPASITTQDSLLAVAPTKTLSLIGGHLNLNGQLPIQFDEKNIYATFAPSFLKAPNGQINLVAINSASEVILQDRFPFLSGQGGNINLNNTMLDASGLGAGAVFIRGHNLSLQDSVLQSNNLGEFDGFGLDIRLTGDFYTGSQYPWFNSLVSKNFGAGNGGNIFIQAAEAFFSSSMAETTTFSGNAGNINIEVQRLALKEGADISADTLGGGQGGHIQVQARDSVLISGYREGAHIVDGGIFINQASGIGGTSHFFEGKSSLGFVNVTIKTKQLDLVEGIIITATSDKGDAGNIVIEAENMNMTQGASISTGSIGSGMAGHIDIDVKNTLLISGRHERPIIINEQLRSLIGEDIIANAQSSIFSSSLNGLGGEINIKAKNIQLSNDAVINSASMSLGESVSHINIESEHLSLSTGAQINNSNGFYAGNVFILGNGQGSNINIKASQLTLIGHDDGNLAPTGIFSDTYNHGQGGNILIQTENLSLKQYATISAGSFNTGDAGKIQIHSQNTHLDQNSAISTTSDNAGGGNIDLQANELLYLNQSQISTSVKTGQGDGGNLSIFQPTFVVLDQAKIKAQADEGEGGNIRIAAKQFIKSSESLVTASSKLGLDGEVQIDSPTVDLDAMLLVLPGGYIEQAQLKNCTSENIDNPSTFKLNLNRDRTLPFGK